jgi:hypothetical protein
MTSLPVLVTFRWAVWGAPITVWQYVSLLGSCLLVLAGLVSFYHRRVAARIAVVAVAAIWSFYFLRSHQSYTHG